MALRLGGKLKSEGEKEWRPPVQDEKDDRRLRIEICLELMNHQTKEAYPRAR